MVNLIQVYSTLYILDSLNMYKVSVCVCVERISHVDDSFVITHVQLAIAIGPLVIYLSGLVSTFSINYINKWAGQNVSSQATFK